MSTTPPTITGVLVANRGEIARRVFRTARGMGLRCVAVYVDADAGTPYVTEADVAVRLADGGHMDGDAIVAAALASAFLAFSTLQEDLCLHSPAGCASSAGGAAPGCRKGSGGNPRDPLKLLVNTQEFLGIPKSQ